MLNDVAGSSPALLDGTNWTILEPRDSSLVPRVERIQSPAASLTEPDEIRRRSARACHRGTRAQKGSSSPGPRQAGTDMFVAPASPRQFTRGRLVPPGRD